MSFGFSVGDFIQVIGLARKAYNSCRNAPSEFHEVGRETGSLYAILEALEDEVSDPKSPLLLYEERQRHFAEIITGCGVLLVELEKISTKYSTLGTENTKILHRFRFPHKEVAEIRAKLSYHTNMLSTFLNTIGLGTLGRVEKRLDAAEESSLQVHESLKTTSDGLVRVEQCLTKAETFQVKVESKLDDATSERREILKAVHDLGSEFRAGAREKSVLTDHTDDNAEVWKLFRRELIGEGFKSEAIDRHRIAIKNHIRFLCENGLLEEETPRLKEKQSAAQTVQRRKSSVKPVAKAQDWIAHTPLNSSTATLVASEHRSQGSASMADIRVSRHEQCHGLHSAPENYYRDFHIEAAMSSQSSFSSKLARKSSLHKDEEDTNLNTEQNIARLVSSYQSMSLPTDSRQSLPSIQEMAPEVQTTSVGNVTRGLVTTRAMGSTVFEECMSKKDSTLLIGKAYQGVRQIQTRTASYSETKSNYQKPTVQDCESVDGNFDAESEDERKEAAHIPIYPAEPDPLFDKYSRPTPSLPELKSTTYAQSHIYRGLYPEDQDYDGIPVADPFLPELRFHDDDDLDSLTSAATTKPKYPKNSKMHGFVIKAFAKADPFGHYYISPDIVAKVMWRITEDLARKRIEPPPIPWWKLTETEDERKEKEQTEVRIQEEERYASKLDHYHRLVKAISENVVSSFGIEMAKKATDLKAESSFKPGSLESFIAGAADIWRGRKNSSGVADARRKRYLHDVMTAIQVAQARDKERIGQRSSRRQRSRSRSRSRPMTRARRRRYNSTSSDDGDDSCDDEPRGNRARDEARWTWVFEGLSSIQAGDREEYFAAKNKIQGSVVRAIPALLKSRNSRSVRDRSPPPPYSPFTKARSRTSAEGLDIDIGSFVSRLAQSQRSSGRHREGGTVNEGKYGEIY